MTRQEFWQDMIERTVNETGSLRKAAEQINLDVAVLSKIKNGKYTPSLNTTERYFPGSMKLIDEDKDQVINVVKIVINCQELKALEAQLAEMGYEITYTIKKSRKK